MNSKVRSWLCLSSGNGPQECELALEKLLAVIRSDAFACDLSFELVDCTYGRHPNMLKSAFICVSGDTAKDFSARWIGGTCWVCASPLRPRIKRKNWYVGVSQMQAPSTMECHIESKDLVWTTMKSSGPGGQHVNKTDSAVRLKHLPSGVGVSASEERSQHANRKIALQKLVLALQLRESEDKSRHDKSIWKNHTDLQRGGAARIFLGMEFKQK